MSRYRVRIETYFGYNEYTFDAETKLKAIYKAYKYQFVKSLKFKDFLIIFRPNAEKVSDNALMTYKEYGSIYGYRDNLSYIDMMKDVQPVKHEKKADGVCPRCGIDIMYEYGISKTAQCPHCGARMDGVAND